MLGLYFLGSTAATAWARADRLGAAVPVLAVVVLIGIAAALVRWLHRRELVDPKLVQLKLARDACRVELRMAVFAPTFADPRSVEDRLDRVAGAYRAFALGAGNSLVPEAVGQADLRCLSPIGRGYLLNVREVAGLWHLPQAADDVPFVERTTARRRLPLAARSPGRGGGCRIGISAHQGQSCLCTAAGCWPPPAGHRQDSSRQVEPAAATGASPDAAGPGARRAADDA